MIGRGVSMITNEYLLVIPALITAILISYLLMPMMIRVSSLKKIIEEQETTWGIKNKIISTLGGIGVLTAFMVSFYVWANAYSIASFPYLIAGLFILLLLGLNDDSSFKPVKKYTIQTIAAGEIVIGGNLVIENLNGLFGFYMIPWTVGALISIGLIIWLVNAFNSIDDIDGLAGGIGTIASTILGIWFWSAGFGILAILSFVLTGSLIGFLIFNIHPAKIFLGKTGAMAMGYILAFLILKFIGLNGQSETGIFTQNAHVFSLAILIVPFIDTIRSFLLRRFKSSGDFTPEYYHMHDDLRQEGIREHFIAFYLWMGNLLIIALSFLFIELETNFYTLIILSAGMVMLPVILFLHRAIHRNQKSEFKSEKKPLYEYDASH